MDIKHFRYFIAVAETLSFAKAARDLKMSSPPLSTRIIELEREMGFKLFDRNSRKVELTPAGKAFLPRARDAVRAFDAAMREARILSPAQSRHLRIAFASDISRRTVIDVVSRLQQKQMEVDIVEAPTAEQRRLLATGEIDIGILRYPFETRGLRVSAPLAQRLGVVFDAEHPLAKVDKLHLADLNPYALVLFPRCLHPDLYDELLELCRAGGYVPPRILHGTGMVASFLEAELAVILAMEIILKQIHEAGPKEFVWRPLENPQIHRWASVVCRSDEWDGITRAAVDVIVASIQQHDKWIPMPRPAERQQLCETLSRAISHHGSLDT